MVKSVCEAVCEDFWYGREYPVRPGHDQLLAVEALEPLARTVDNRVIFRETLHLAAKHKLAKSRAESCSDRPCFG
jgi:hypothetical protein